MTAVLVCRNAGSWLNATLAGIARLDRRPDMIIAVDNNSDDDTRSLLLDAEERGMIDVVVNGQSYWSFGEGVRAGLAHAPERTDWIWLLHDDAVPDPAALTELLFLGANNPTMAIGVPLLVRPSRRNHVSHTLEIGATISGSGRRDLGLELDEVAQGQYDSHAVLGGSTAGMLVKWASFEAIGTFDKAIGSYRDGVDLGWRVQLIDEWVMTAPKARLVHRQVGRSEIRTGTIAKQHNRSEAAWDRLMGLRLVCAHSHGLGRILTWFRLVFATLVRALGFLLGKAPDRAGDEIVALGDFIFASRRLISGLRKKNNRIAKGKDSRTRVRALRPSIGSTLEAAGQSVAHWLQDLFGSGDDSDMTLDDLLGDEYSRRIGEGRKKVPVGVWMGLVLAAVALMARGLFRSGQITAPGLLGAPATWQDALSLALAGSSQGYGLPSPWLLICAVASVLAVHPTWLVLIAILVLFPAAMLMAAWFAKYRILNTRLRWLAAAGYASLPIVMGGLNHGAIWLMVVAVLLPFLAEWVQRIDMPWSGARSIQTMAGIAFAGVFLLPILPAMWIVIIVVCILVAALRGTVGAVFRAFIAAGLPVAVWALWIPSLARNPVRLLMTPEASLTPASTGWQMIVGRPGAAESLPPLWVSIVVFAVVWLAAIISASFNPEHRKLFLSGMAVVAASMWLSHLHFTLSSFRVVADPSPWLLIGFAILLLSGVRWMDDTMGDLSDSDFGFRQALLGLMSFLMAACFLIGGVWSVWAGASQVTRGEGAQLPQYLSQTEIDRGAATLIIDAADGTWNVRANGSTIWGQGDHPEGALLSTQARSRTELFVASALAGLSDQTGAEHLATLGVSSVVVTNPTPGTVTALDTVPGIQRPTSSPTLQIWNVLGNPDPPTRMTLVSGNVFLMYLTPTQEIPEGVSRTLLLATVPDDTLRVFVGGVEVEPVPGPDWRAAYDVGTASGVVTTTRDVSHSWMVWGQLGVFVLLFIFIFPPLGDGTGASSRPRRGVKGVEE
ncbi:MAG: glycosyltransferase [Propionibacteriaceae bacterium]|nr:glycosyltransferase [Propionibacteriaceae bacterium]